MKICSWGMICIRLVSNHFWNIKILFINVRKFMIVLNVEDSKHFTHFIAGITSINSNIRLKKLFFMNKILKALFYILYVYLSWSGYLKNMSSIFMLVSHSWFSQVFVIPLPLCYGSGIGLEKEVIDESYRDV